MKLKMTFFRAFLKGCIMIFSFFLFNPIMAQTDKIIVTGRIVDATDVQIQGVDITVSGFATKGTLSDKNGQYSISVFATDTLVYSHVGYETQIVPVLGIKNHKYYFNWKSWDVG